VTTRAERRSAAREAILAAAHERVASGGFAAAVMTDVAREAGVATGTLYRHFPSKGALLAETFRVASGRELQHLGAIATDDKQEVRTRIAATVEAFARRALAAPVLAYALMAEPVDPAVEAARLENKRAWRALFAGLLAEGVARGELPPQDERTNASAIVGALQEALIGPLADGGGDALVAGLVTFILHAVGYQEEPDDPHTRPHRRAAHHS
jgi:AcrR family transcriptional regulator